VCNASDTVTSSTPCPYGQTGGPIETHQVVSCPGSVSSTKTTGACTPATCANGATNWPTCTVAVVCPAQFNWCSFTPGQSGDPRDDWYEWGWQRYVGPTCEMEIGLIGTSTGAGQGAGCPPGY
jgi:hypothetical protein